jgi:serine/threonine protein kinase
MRIVRTGGTMHGQGDFCSFLSVFFILNSCFTKQESGQLVAVKILRNRKPFYNQGLVEVRTLQYLNSRDPEGRSHTVRMILSFVHRQHLCIVFELLGMNLYDILRRTSFVGLSLGLVRRFAQQLVHALYFLSQVGIIHCDLSKREKERKKNTKNSSLFTCFVTEPENVLLKENKKSVIKGCRSLFFERLSFEILFFFWQLLTLVLLVCNRRRCSSEFVCRFCFVLFCLFSTFFKHRVSFFFSFSSLSQCIVNSTFNLASIALPRSSWSWITTVRQISGAADAYSQRYANTNTANIFSILSF